MVAFQIAKIGTWMVSFFKNFEKEDFSDDVINWSVINRKGKSS